MPTGLLVLPFPAIDPVALEIGPIAIRWYGLAYMAGLLLGWFYLRRLLANNNLWPDGPPIKPNLLDDLIIYVTIGVIVGGRLGSVLLYHPEFYFQNPLEIFKIWNGGMAFHGGLIGTVLAIILFARKQGVSPFFVGDLVCAAVPIGMFFGRIANFINGELWGKVSNVPWAMVFPAAGPESRHPSQLYEALLEGAILFLVLWFLIHHRNWLRTPGMISGMFLSGMAAGRIVSEIFRVGDPVPGLEHIPYSAGIIYSIPLFLIGIGLLAICRKNPSLQAHR